jgi:hypothetical protein
VSEFRVAAAQVASLRGELAQNVRTHAAAITAAAKHGVSVLVFPELSLVGYEPELAATHAIAASDARLAPLGELAQQHWMHVVAGVPLAVAGQKPAQRFGSGLLQLFYCTREECQGSGGWEPFADDLSRVRVVHPNGPARLSRSQGGCGLWVGLLLKQPATLVEAPAGETPTRGAAANQRLKLTVAAILVSRGVQSLLAAPAT